MVLPTTALPRARVPTEQITEQPRLDDYGREAYGRSDMLGDFLRATYSYNQPYEPPAWSKAIGYAPMPSTLADPAAAPDWRSQGFPTRIQLPNILDTSRRPSAAEQILAGDAGVALGIVPGAQRGGFVNGIATTPMTMANFPTWGREGALALATRFLTGDTYLQPEDAQFGVRPRPQGPPAGPVEAGLQGLVEGLNVVGDAVWAISDGATRIYRDGEAQYRATQVARILQEGHASRPVLPWEHGFIDNVMTSIFPGVYGSDSAKYSLDEIREAAWRNGVDIIDMMATFYDLDPAIVSALYEDPWMADEQRNELVRDQPFSRDALKNLGIEASIQLALLGAGGIGVAKGAAAITRLGRGPEALQAFTNALAGGQRAEAATSIGSRMGHTLGFVTKKGAQLNAWNTGVGWSIRGMEWGIKQVAGIVGDQGVVDAMDRLMWEMPLSMNPGVNVIDGFTTHPLRHWRQLRGREGPAGQTGRRIVIGDEGGISEAGTFDLSRRTFTRPTRADGALDVDALARVRPAGPMDIGVADAVEPLPASHAIPRMVLIAGALEPDDMHARLFSRVGITRDQLELMFGENNAYKLDWDDARNTLIYLYTQLVREEGGGPRLLLGSTPRERSLEFAREASDEAVDMLISDLKGETGHLARAVKGQWWELDKLNDSNIAEVKARLAENYDPLLAADNMARWVSLSKITRDAYRAGQIAEDIVPTYARRINLEYVRSMREHVTQTYQPRQRVLQRDIQRLRDKGGLVEELVPQLGQGRRKWTREQFLVALDRIENLVMEARTARPPRDPLLPLDWEPGLYFASDARVLGVTPEDVMAIRAVQREGAPASPPPTNAIREAAQATGRNPDELARDPAAAWEVVLDWMEQKLEATGEANRIRRPLEGFAEALRVRASEGRMDPDLARLSADAIDRIAIEVLNEPRARPPTGAVRRPGDPQVDYADAAGVARWQAARERAGAVASRVESHLEEPAGRLRIVERLLPGSTDEVASHAVLRGHEAALGWAMDLSDYVATHPGTVLFDDLDAALIADPAVHPLLKIDALRQGDWRGAERVIRGRVEELQGDGVALARQTAAEVLGEAPEGADLVALMQQADAAALSYRGAGEALADELLDVARAFETVEGRMAPETLLVHDRMRAAQVPITRPLSGPTEIATAQAVRARELRPLQADLARAEARLAEHERRLADLGRPLAQELDWEPAHTPTRPRKYLAQTDADLLRSQTGLAYQVVKEGNRWRVMRGTPRARVEEPPAEVTAPVVVDMATGEPTPAAPLTGAEGAIEQAYAAGDIETGQRLNLEAEAANGAAGRGGPSEEFARMRAEAEAAEEALTAREVPAPEVEPEGLIPVETRGAPTEFPDPIDETQRVPATFALREVDEIVTDADAGFDRTLQPRGRGQRIASEEQIERLARTFDPDLALRVESGGDGPPLIVRGNMALAGNGRTQAMRRMSADRWSAYRTVLARRAEEFGLTPEQVMAMDRPVLVRELDDAYATPEYASAFNARTGGMSPAEMSVALSRLITPDDVLALRIAEGTSMAAALARADNRPFVLRLLDSLTPEQRRSYLTAEGELSQSGVALIRGAMLGKILPDTGLVTRLIEQTGDAVRYTGGIEEAMPQVLQAEAKAALAGDPVELGPALSLSLRRILDLSDQGVRAADWPSYFTTEGMGFIEGAAEGDALALVMASLRNQDEVATFLRGYAKAVDDSTAAAGGLLIAEDRSWQGFVNRGVEAVEARRASREQRRQSASFFGSEDVPRMPERDGTIRAEYETPDGSLAQAVERPIVGTPADAVAAETTGASVIHVDDIAAIDTLPDAPISLRPANAVQYATYARLREVDGPTLEATMRERFAHHVEAREGGYEQSMFDGLRDSVNAGTASAADFYVLRALSNTKHRYTPEGLWDGRYVGAIDDAAIIEAIGDARADMVRAQRVTELIPPDQPSVPPVDGAAVVTSAPRTLRPDFEQEAGFAPDPAPDLARVDELRDSGARVVVPPGDEYAQRLAQTSGNLPRGRRDAAIIDLNAIDQAQYLRYLTAARDLAQQDVAALQSRIRGIGELAEAPPAGPPIELPADLLELYQRYMADPLAEAIGPVAPPRTIGELFEAVRSIDYGFPPASAMTDLELERLRVGLRDHMHVKLDEWGVPDRAPEAPVPPVRNMVGATPTEHDQFLADLADRLAQRTFVADSPIEGYTLAGYDFVPAPRRSTTGEPLRQRLFFEDFMEAWTPELEQADQLVPGLGRELQTGRMRTFEGRLEDALAHDAAARLGSPGFARTLRGLIDTTVGARPQRDISREAVDRFIGEILAIPAEQMARIIDDPALYRAYQDAIRAARAVVTKWHEEMADIKWGPFQQYRRVGLVKPEMLDKWAREALEGQGDAGRNILTLMDQRVGRDGIRYPFAAAWRKADNRVRAYFAERPGGAAEWVERLYENRYVKIGSERVRGLTVYYHVGRFLMDLRWLAQEFLEAPVLVLGREGLDPFLAMFGVKREGFRFRGGHEPRPMFMGEDISARLFDQWAWWLAQGDTGGWMRWRQRAVLSMLDRHQQRGFVEALERLAREDPQMRSMIEASGDTPLGFLRKLDRDWDLVARRGAPIPEPRMRELLDPYLADGTLSPTEYAEFVRNGRWTNHPALEQAIAYADDPVSRTLLRRLQVINEQGFNDITQLVYGQVDRSNIQRLANHPLLYWPISYQIKVTRWLAGLLLDRMGGFDTGAGGATTLGLIWEANRDALLNDPEFQESVRANSTLLFAMQMLLPVTPWDIGVSLSPFTRLGLQMAFGSDDPYRRNFVAVGTGYTWFELLPRLLYEQNKPGGLGTQGIPFLSTAIERAQHALPFKISVDAPGSGAIEQAAQQTYPQPPPPVAPFERPPTRFGP